MSKNVAVVLAGGVGARMGMDIPKQLLKVAGRTILEHTVAALHDHDQIDEVVVMMAPGHHDQVHSFLRGGRYPKVLRVVDGGETRNETTMKALEVVGEDSVVLMHDAVRPLVSTRIITDCLTALQEREAVDVVIPSADTIVAVGPGGRVADIPPRASLRRGQTPQGFRSGTLRRAYELARQDPAFLAAAGTTDDCSIVLRYLPEVEIALVEGEERNMKVTAPIDVYLADKLFQLTSQVSGAAGTDEDYGPRVKGKTFVVFGGSYGIGADVADIAERLGARVFRFSRSATGTHVERRGDVVAARDAVLAETGSVDFVVNAAGVLPRGELATASEEDVYSATEINYLAPVFISQAFFGPLRASGGSLLLFTSSSYTRGRSGYSLYSSAKAAVVNLTQALADEWGGSGVRVNCINPERTGTPMRTKAFGHEPPETLLDSEVVARACLDALLSPDTGHVIDVRRVDPLSSYAAAAELAEATDRGEA